MEVTPEMVDRIAHLARLSFDETEKEEIRGDLEKMIGFVDRLRELDLSGVDPVVQPGGRENVWRKDTPEQALPSEEVLREAPGRSGPFFSVPKVIQKS